MSTTSNRVTGYLSEYKGSEIDATVLRVREINIELDSKADKSLEINGHPLTANISLTAGDVGAMSDETPVGVSLELDEEWLLLKDKNGNTLSSVFLGGSQQSTTYIHEQGIASNIWVIRHNLNKFPSVTLVDSAGSVFNASVKYDSPNQCTVRINGATTGKAYLN